MPSHDPMNNPFDLRLVELDIDGAAEPELALAAEPDVSPRVLTRTITAPSGWPWEQVRGATLEARHGAPLPIAQVYLQIRRLTPWRANQPATFAAFYVRAAEITARLKTVIEVEGRSVKVMFEPPEAVARRARRSLITGLATAGVVALLVVAAAGALLARAEGEQQLSAMERDAAVKLRRAETVQAARRESAALTLVQPGDRPAAPITDLAWAMAAQAPNARIEAWHWGHGVVEVEARGEAAPFVDPRRVMSRTGPVRPGVWRWRIEPDGARS
jgi:hypothetical protein